MPARQKVTRYVGDLLVCQERLQEVFREVICACKKLGMVFHTKSLCGYRYDGLEPQDSKLRKPANSSKLNDYFTN